MKKLRGINLAIVILTAILAIFIGFICLQINGDKIVKNTYIKGIHVGGLTKEEAKLIVKNECKIDTITLKYKNDSWKIQPDDIDTSYNIEKTVENAFTVNRKNNLFSNLIVTMKSYLGDENDVNIVLEFNEEKVKEKLDNIGIKINTEMVNASLDVINGQINISNEECGLELDVKETISKLRKSLQNGILEEDLIVVKVEPEITKKDLESVDSLLGTYTTNLSDKSPGRMENIKIAAQRTSGVLLMPGEEFSYNEHTGERTEKNGYKNATVIVSGEAVQGVGGGVCQVSSTLYNAVLYAGLEIVEVTNHSIPSSYVSKGRDATVSDTGLDFVFKNNYNQPIYIKNYYSNNVVICQIYGNIKDKKNIEIVTNIDKVGDIPVKKENDPSLEKGVEKILERGRNSYSVSTYRVYYDENGNEIKREKVASSYYPSKQQVIAIGTKEETKEEPEDEVPDNNQDNSQDNSNNSGNNNDNNDSSNNDNNNDDSTDNNPPLVEFE